MQRFIGSFIASTPLHQQIGDTAYLQFSNPIAYSGKCDIVSEDGITLALFGFLLNYDQFIEKYQPHSPGSAYALITGYKADGIEAFKIADGSFVIILFTSEKCLIIRDRHGIGGQVFYSDKYFTNNLYDFKKIKGFSITPDYNSLSAFMYRGYIPSPFTSLAGIKKLEAGHVLSYENTVFKSINLFPISEFSMEEIQNSSEAVEQYRLLHTKSIARRIAGFDKVGILLSGGYDSGGNIHQLRNLYNGDIKAFSVGFENNPWSELPLAQLLANRYNADFKSYTINGSEISFLPHIVRQTGDPFQEGGLMVNYCAMRMASGHDVPIILGGDANDQFFGTAVKEVAIGYFLKRYRLEPLTKLMQSLFSIFDSSYAFRLNFHLSKIHDILHPDAFGLVKKEQKALFNHPDASFFDPFASHSYKANNFDQFYLFRNYYVDIQQVINEVILFKASQMANLWNQNLRFPYADLELYNLLKELPRTLKAPGSLEEIIKKGTSAKYLHKLYLKPLLPTEITTRKKQGGFAPLPVFFRDLNRRKAVFDYIETSNFGAYHLNKNRFHDFIKAYYHVADNPSSWFWHKQVMAFKLMNLLTLSVWYDIFINNFDDDNLSQFNIK